MDGAPGFEQQTWQQRQQDREQALSGVGDQDDAMRECTGRKETIRQDVVIANRMGLHARPAMQFVDLANKFNSKITVCKGGQCVNGKSIMDMMLLAAGAGTTLTLVAEGADAAEAVKALKDLVDRKFDED